MSNSVLSSHLLQELGVKHAFIAANAPASLVLEQFTSGQLTFPKQVHGKRVVHFSSLANQPADGLWTAQKSRGIAIKTADCIPALLAHPSGRVAAIHAGWRGVVQNIVEFFLQTQKRLSNLAFSDWRIALGPAADSCCYEVGPEVTVQLGLLPKQQKIDLRGILIDRLHALGVKHLERVGCCTICDTNRMWASYRREKNDAARNIACIWPNVR